MAKFSEFMNQLIETVINESSNVDTFANFKKLGDNLCEPGNSNASELGIFANTNNYSNPKSQTHHWKIVFTQGDTLSTYHNIGAKGSRTTYEDKPTPIILTDKGKDILNSFINKKSAPYAGYQEINKNRTFVNYTADGAIESIEYKYDDVLDQGKEIDPRRDAELLKFYTIYVIRQLLPQYRNNYEAIASFSDIIATRSFGKQEVGLSVTPEEVKKLCTSSDRYNNMKNLVDTWIARSSKGAEVCNTIYKNARDMQNILQDVNAASVSAYFPDDFDYKNYLLISVCKYIASEVPIKPERVAFSINNKNYEWIDANANNPTLYAFRSHKPGDVDKDRAKGAIDSFKSKHKALAGGEFTIITPKEGQMCPEAHALITFVNKDKLIRGLGITVPEDYDTFVTFYKNVNAKELNNRLYLAFQKECENRQLNPDNTGKAEKYADKAYDRIQTFTNMLKVHIIDIYHENLMAIKAQAPKCETEVQQAKEEGRIRQ